MHGPLVPALVDIDKSDGVFNDRPGPPCKLCLYKRGIAG